jgi:hypothetical protein
MRNLWKLTWGASLGLLVTGARADDIKWTAAAPAPKSVIASTRTTSIVIPPQAKPSAPAPLPIADNFVVPAGHSQPMTVPPPTVQYIELPQNSDIPKPMPSGAVSAGSGSSAGSINPPPIASSKLGGDKIEPIPAPTPLDTPSKDIVIMPGGEVGGPVVAMQDGDCGNGAMVGNGGECCTSCGDGCSICGEECCPCMGCFGCPTNLNYISAEYLLWQIRPSDYPPLVTTSNNPNATPPGAIGQPGTNVLFGNQGIPTRPQSGMRFTIGHWFDPEHSWGLEASFFMLVQSSTDESINSSQVGNLGIFRPFFDTATGMQSAELTSLPGLVSGGVDVRTTSVLWGAEVNVRKNLFCTDWYHIDALAGFRHVGMNEGLNVNENLTTLRDLTIGNFGTVPGGSNFALNDSFNTSNRFYGAQIGLSQEFRFLNRFFVDLNTKVAFGTTRQTVQINGSTAFTPPGGPTTTYVGGLLAQQSNIGNYSTNGFSVVPEIGLNLGVNINEHWRVFAGYSFLFWSNVVRPGEQVPLRINSNQLPPPLANGGEPVFAFHTTDFWVHGVNIGVEYRW